jgi:hypothetical protein
MPTVEEYLSGFNVKEGQRYGRYILKEINIDHHSIVRWNEYSYPTELIFEFINNRKPTREDDDECINAFSHHVKGEKVIRTSSGRPYICEFFYYENKTEFIDDNNYFIIKCTGHAKRVSEAVANM